MVSCATPHVPATRPETAGEPNWKPWSKEAFDDAQREHKLLLISIQAGWCHWCHVMNATTYRDKRVVALLRDRFVTIRVDQDSRPDLAERYADWGWPATGILTPNARTIVNLRGHQPADAFLALLSDLVNELDHGGALASRIPPLPPAKPAAALDITRDHALAQLDATYDDVVGGWGAPQKYPLAVPVEHALFRARVYGERSRDEQVKQTLTGYAQLIDPVAFGMFQYSLRSVWSAPHYEKIAPIQAGAMRAFSAAFRATGRQEYRTAAEQVGHYVLNILRSPSGAFYASQDADVGHVGSRDHLEGRDYYALDEQQRASAGSPNVDRHVYTNLNGMLIRALCELYLATLDERFRDGAVRAARALEQTRDETAYRHQQTDTTQVRYLADQVDMAAALDALADATLEPEYRMQSDKLLDYIVSRFTLPSGALAAHTTDPSAVGELATPTTPYADNALAARLLLRRAHRNANDSDRERALTILKALSDPARVAEQGRMIGDYLLALEEALGRYVMFSIVGPLDDRRTQALARGALTLHAPHALVHIATPDTSRYPYPSRPAVYLCSETACSAPVTELSALAQAFEDFDRAEAGP